jgi:hypothetical protein
MFKPGQQGKAHPAAPDATPLDPTLDTLLQPISDEQRIPSIAEDTHIFLASEGSPFGCCSPCCRPCQASCGPSQATCCGHPTTLGGDPPGPGQPPATRPRDSHPGRPTGPADPAPVRPCRHGGYVQDDGLGPASPAVRAGVAHVLADRLSRVYAPGGPGKVDRTTHPALMNSQLTEVPERNSSWYRTS